MALQVQANNRLKQFRQQQGLALYGLAAIARVSPTTLSAIERWDYRPRLEVRQRIAKALGVALSDIWPDGGMTEVRVEIRKGEADAAQLAAWRRLWQILLSEGEAPPERTMAVSVVGVTGHTNALNVDVLEIWPEIGEGNDEK
jgi:DNA-binding XRE family transcriptional regulator